MRQLIIYVLLLFLALLPLAGCTNDETDDGLETLTPNEPAETGADGIAVMPGVEDNS